MINFRISDSWGSSRMLWGGNVRKVGRARRYKSAFWQEALISLTRTTLPHEGRRLKSQSPSDVLRVCYHLD